MEERLAVAFLVFELMRQQFGKLLNDCIDSGVALMSIFVCERM